MVAYAPSGEVHYILITYRGVAVSWIRNWSLTCNFVDHSLQPLWSQWRPSGHVHGCPRMSSGQTHACHLARGRHMNKTWLTRSACAEVVVMKPTVSQCYFVRGTSWRGVSLLKSWSRLGLHGIMGTLDPRLLPSIVKATSLQPQFAP